LFSSVRFNTQQLPKAYIAYSWFVPIQTNALSAVADRLPFNTITQIALTKINDTHIATLAAALRGNTSVTSISFGNMSVSDGFDHLLLITDAGVAQLLEIVQSKASITQIDFDEADFYCQHGKLDADMWAAVQAACEVRSGRALFCVGLDSKYVVPSPFLLTVFLAFLHISALKSELTNRRFYLWIFLTGQPSSFRNLVQTNAEVIDSSVQRNDKTCLYL
jgi:hypothetical protein